jgi:CBS domain-containing protein
MLAEEIMSRNVVTVGQDASVSDAAAVMSNLQIGCVVVRNRERIVGILTERDILASIVIPGKNSKDVKVRDIMSSPVKMIAPDASVEEVADIMSASRIRRLPVVKDRKLIGIVTSSDVVRIYLDVDKVIRELAVKDTDEIRKRAQKYGGV